MQQLFDAATRLDGEARTHYLDRACANDIELRREVDAMLGLVDQAEPYFDEVFSMEPEDAEHRAMIGKRFGAYEVLELIGQGGMGCVYLARRADQQYDQTVAIKTLARDRRRKDLVSRFAREYRILARLEHPNIARLLDAGQSDDKSPFFVMEYVQGEPIDDYCNERTLTLHQRLRLIRSIAQATAFAHRELVVHCDLKPGNVMVTTTGQIKLLDFGVSSLLSREREQDGPDQSPHAPSKLTPNYAAPEQWLGGNESVATDIYSLGVMMFKLLCGLKPYTTEQLLGMRKTGEWRDAPIDMLEVLDECSEADAKVLGRNRDLHPDALRRALHGDLSAIVRKAMATRPADRYVSMSALRQDIDNYFEHHPVSAHPSTPLYVAKKWVRRQRWPLVTASSILIAVTVLAVQNFLTAERAREQTRATGIERDKANLLTELMTNMITTTDPTRGDAGTISVREALLRNAPVMIDQLHDQPDVQLRLTGLIGSMFTQMGLHVDATPHLDQAIELLEAKRETSGLSAEEMDQITKMLLARATNAAGRGDADDGIFYAQRAEAAITRYFGAQDWRLLDALNTRGEALVIKGQHEQALEMARKAVEFAQSHPDADVLQRAIAHNNLGIQIGQRGDDAGAQREINRARQILLEADLGHHPMTLNVTATLAASHLNANRDEQAAELYQSVLDATDTIIGSPQMSIAIAHYGLASINLKREQFDEALAAFDRARVVISRFRTAGDGMTLQIALGRATTFDNMERFDEAIAEYQRVLDKMSANYPQSPQIGKIYGRLAGIAAHIGEAGADNEHIMRARSEIGDATPRNVVATAYLAASEAWMVRDGQGVQTTIDTLAEALHAIEQAGATTSLAARRIRGWLARLGHTP